MRHPRRRVFEVTPDGVATSARPTPRTDADVPQALDTLRLALAAAPGGAHREVLQVFVNEVEMTSIGAGLGMPALAVFSPVNTLAPQGTPHVAPIARCDCGDYGCAMTDVRITVDGDIVRWDWLEQEPVNRSPRFAAAAYLREIRRMAALVTQRARS